tara:strand:- start:95 stop:631 length:537 start_codon:yes stop_codon:yes gene_type:complete
MIISCNNCNKKFNLDSDLISNKGRLLQCSSCNHEWFFKKEIFENTPRPIVDDNINIFNQNKLTNNVKITPLDIEIDEADIETEKDFNKKIKIDVEEKPEKESVDFINEDIPAIVKSKEKKSFKILNILIVVFISFVAFIIIVDTFKHPIGQVVPNVELILYNLYESIKDISLFINDLI